MKWSLWPSRGTDVLQDPKHQIWNPILTKAPETSQYFPSSVILKDHKIENDIFHRDSMCKECVWYVGMLAVIIRNFGCRFPPSHYFFLQNISALLITPRGNTDVNRINFCFAEFKLYSILKVTWGGVLQKMFIIIDVRWVIKSGPAEKNLLGVSELLAERNITHTECLLLK